jgi:hypothetical protein
MTPETRRRWPPWRRSRRTPDLDRTRADLVVVASGTDDAEASSVGLERGAGSEPRWRPGELTVLRHLLALPADQADDAVAVAAQDGYAVTAQASGDTEPPGPGDAAGVVVVLERVQVLDALHLSQERSRMAGLAQRRGGAVLGWQALQPASAP